MQRHAVLLLTLILLPGFAQAQFGLRKKPEGNLGEMFFQMQVLKEEMRELRGEFEETRRELDVIKEQNKTRYVDIDQRLAELNRALEAQAQQVATTGTAQPAATPKADSSESSDGVTVDKAASAPKPENEVDVYRDAYTLLKAKKFKKATGSFKAFVEKYPDGKYTGNAYYWLGELYYVQKPKDLEASRSAFSTLLSKYPRHRKSPDALYKLAKVYHLQGENAKAKHLLNQVVDRYSNTSSAAPDLAKRYLAEKF